MAITCSSSITIADNVLIGAGCKLYDTDFHSIDPIHRYGDKIDNSFARSKEIVINEGAFIGAHSIVLKGSVIGKNSVIGAGSVVCGTIPDYEVWAGIPARFIRKIERGKVSDAGST